MEASADRAEYDDKTGAIRLFSKVRFKSGGDLVDSEYMQYNTTITHLADSIGDSFQPHITLASAVNDKYSK